MKRRTFLSFLAYSATFTHLIGKQAYIFQDSERAKALSDAGNVLLALQKQKKNVISLVLQGRKFKRNVDHHYPHPKGVHDENSGYRVFFHGHRNGEYGHFHTFIYHPKGYTHLLMISLDKSGMPIMMSTLNQWVTNDVHLDEQEMIEAYSNFSMDPGLFPDKRSYYFLSYLLKGYKTEIITLMKERTLALHSYFDINGKNPDTDENLEILSSFHIHPSDLGV
ncbi:hypothetical protein LBMAG36_09360 [Chlorobiota bacterium]|nr:hypothetical protein LBMAG36_09360 [Chlorobiota bacterium]